MFLLYIIIILLLSSGITFYKTGFHEGYIAKEQCNCLKGFFIVVVFCRHIAPYLSEAGYDFSLLGDNLFRQIDESIGQLLVVMFLFYSGYGVMESIKKKVVTTLTVSLREDCSRHWQILMLRYCCSFC